jgi:hypothetical protein
VSDPKIEQNSTGYGDGLYPVGNGFRYDKQEKREVFNTLLEESYFRRKLIFLLYPLIT